MTAQKTFVTVNRARKQYPLTRDRIRQAIADGTIETQYRGRIAVHVALEDCAALIRTPPTKKADPTPADAA